MKTLKDQGAQFVHISLRHWQLVLGAGSDEWYIRVAVCVTLLNVQGLINAVQKSCGCLLITSTANYKVRHSAPAVTIATYDVDNPLLINRSVINH